ncbi:bifunctional 3-(3-hydroxy-phenyl)propionate/3-hydroxycinnamic acid hydroxylase [Acidocella sp.]|uniref:bifunctional 3-(3-hydroxy-phenyl)propionate/3-hydroxycinnamic acid hydroxylase MhpA n=1 Tax=Acidocella sp. TaxID=50710 RepID=UPI003D0254E9
MTDDRKTCLSSLEADVVIVGCGPVGALLGNLLGLQGIRVVILDREAAAYHLPRAVQFDAEVMRLLQTAGLAKEMEPLLRVVPGMRFIDDEGRLLLDWARPIERGPQGWHESYRFHQPELEALLRAGLARFATITQRYHAEVYAITQSETDATVQYEDLNSGKLFTCKAAYVVGCDGARSLARRLIGKPLDDLGFNERWLVVDVLLLHPCPDLGEHAVQFCSTQRPATYIRGTGDRRRWEIAVLPGDDEARLIQPSTVLDLLKRWVKPEDVRIERAALYTFRSAVAARWRDRRLLIAGDAAHLTPPFLGQGMCAGMRDAGNLAWKLGRVLHGLNDTALLDSYQSERIPHVREYIELAIKLGGLINTTAMAGAVPESALDDREVMKMRSIKPKLGAGVAAEWRMGPLRTIARQTCLDDGHWQDDAAGYRYAALLTPGLAAQLPAALRTRLEARDVALLEGEDAQPQAWLRELGAAGVLVRPDRYVLGTVNSVQDLDALSTLI